MRRSWPAFALLLGCSPFAVTRRPIESPANPDRGRLILKVVSGDRLARGYVFTVRNGEDFAEYLSRAEPTVLEDVHPGRIRLWVSGRRSSPRFCQFDVNPGEEATVEFRLRQAKAAEAAEDFALVTGKVVAYTALGVLYVVVWLPIESLVHGDSGDDDDDDDFQPVRGCSQCGHSPCSCARPPPRPDPKPRVRSLLKDKP